MEKLTYKTFPREVLKKSNINKLELVKWMGIDNVTFDTAVPQSWLNNFVSENKLDYGETLSNLVYVYPGHGLPSGVISGCTEIDKLLGNDEFFQGKWERVECETAPEETIEREREILSTRIQKAIEIYNKKTGETITGIDILLDSLVEEVYSINIY